MFLSTLGCMYLFELVWFFFLVYTQEWASLVAQLVKNLPAVQETQGQSLGWEDSLEKGMATHSSVLAWRIPCTEEPGGLWSTGSQRVQHNWATNTHTPGMELLSHVVVVFLVFWESSILFSIVVVPICIPTNTMRAQFSQGAYFNGLWPVLRIWNRLSQTQLCWNALPLMRLSFSIALWNLCMIYSQPSVSIEDGFWDLSRKSQGCPFISMVPTTVYVWIIEKKCVSGPCSSNLYCSRVNYMQTFSFSGGSSHPGQLWFGNKPHQGAGEKVWEGGLSFCGMWPEARPESLSSFQFQLVCLVSDFFSPSVW